MTADTWQSVRMAFGIAVGLQGTERESHLAGLPEQVRGEVASLLAAHDTAGEFLETEAAGLTPDTRIGPFRILHKIGEGGMGCVYLARRDDAEFDQRVAIK